MARLSAGIIGAGQIVENTHLPNFKKYPDRVETLAIVDVNPDRAKYVAEKFGIPYYFSSYQEMFDKVKLDAVSVCTPNKFHAEAVIAALNHGCNVLCEKPPAISKVDAEKMAQTAKENQKILAYNFHFRQSEEVQSIKRFIDGGEFGEIYYVRVKALRRRGIPGWGVFTNKEIQGGGPLIDIGVHMLDTALYLMDFPAADYVSASAYQKIGTRAGVGLMGSWDPNRFTVEDSAFGFIRFKNGATLVMETSFALNIKERSLMNVELCGEKAGASVFPPVIFTEKHGSLLDMELPYVAEVDKHHQSIKSFIDVCMGYEGLICTAEQGLAIQKIVDALYRSAELGKPVTLD